MNYVELYKLIETLDKNKDGEINYRWEKCSSVLQGTHLPSNLAFCEKCYYRVLFGAIRYLFTFQPGVMIEMFVYSTLWCYKVPIYLPTWFWENCLYTVLFGATRYLFTLRSGSKRNVGIQYSLVLQVPIYLPTWRSERNVFIKYSLVLQGTYLPTNLAFWEKCFYKVLFGATRYLFTYQPGVLREMFL